MLNLFVAYLLQRAWSLCISLQGRGKSSETIMYLVEVCTVLSLRCDYPSKVHDDSDLLTHESSDRC